MRSLCLIACLLLIQSLSAQEILVRAAYDFPGGNYAGTNISRNDQLFAKPGNSLGLTLRYPLKTFLWITAETGIMQHPFDQQKYAEALTATQSNYLVSVTNQSGYHSSYTLIGCATHINKGKFNFGIEANTGLLSMKTPSYLVTETFNGNSGNLYTDSKTIQSYVFGWTLEIGYLCPKNISAGFYLRNLNASMDLPAMNYTSSSQVTKSVQIEIYQTGVQLGYKF